MKLLNAHFSQNLKVGNPNPICLGQRLIEKGNNLKKKDPKRPYLRNFIRRWRGNKM